MSTTPEAELLKAWRAQRAKHPIQVPPDRDPLARWQGDHAALLARLQESFAALWLACDVQIAPPTPSFWQVAAVIKAAQGHMEKMPR